MRCEREIVCLRRHKQNRKGETMRKQKAAVVVEREFSSLCAKELLSCLKSNVLSRDDRKWLFSEFKKKHASEIKHSFLLDLARVAAVIAVTGAVLNEINNAEIKNKEQNLLQKKMGDKK